jgi:hypothetical protein
VDSDLRESFRSTAELINEDTLLKEEGLKDIDREEAIRHSYEREIKILLDKIQFFEKREEQSKLDMEKEKSTLKNKQVQLSLQMEQLKEEIDMKDKEMKGKEEMHQKNSELHQNERINMDDARLK